MNGFVQTLVYFIVAVIALLVIYKLGVLLIKEF